MRSIAFCFLPVALVVSHASEFAMPDFQLSDRAAGGILDRILVGAGIDSVPYVHYAPIIVDRKAGVVEIGLEWSTKPDEKTGEYLTALYFWHIPTSALREPKYMLSVQRVSTEEIVFTMRKPGADRPFLKSPKCRLRKVGKELHGTRVDTRLNVEPNKVPAAMPGQRPPLPPSPSSGAPQR